MSDPVEVASLAESIRHDPPMRSDPVRYPVPHKYIRALCQAAADPADPRSEGQREAARLLKVSDRTVRYWCADTAWKECPWAAAELLRRLLIERAGGDVSGLPDPADFRRDPGAGDVPVMTP